MAPLEHLAVCSPDIRNISGEAGEAFILSEDKQVLVLVVHEVDRHGYDLRSWSKKLADVPRCERVSIE